MTAYLNRWDQALLDVLEERDADRKAALAQEALASADGFALEDAPRLFPPERPGRPDRPALIPPADVPRRRLGSPEGRGALLHALAHIELNAIDLAADMALRFAGEVPDAMRSAFVRDWMQVMGEEGLHFSLLHRRMAELGVHYGDHPAHGGLWDAARQTSGDLVGRLAVAPMILEARGLDVTPGMIGKLKQAGDEPSADVLQVIYNDEIGHVRIGTYWFRALNEARGADPAQTFHKCVMRYYPQGPKRPFNEEARTKAELPRDWYEGVAPQ
ncbi:ferritin-like domain-containing protein [Parvularcula sp. ZS-1/3]|uniref:Ferritin-like domain-containing protein n=1 Tax=Parvularcula mediterranea TaxID=2732508 RepID=A0A7Y3RP80_9PROT|nr:ferritin-like domain-containing protein [Parvularcula mediterranea]NNU17156.1 ferritin-like domain-containing protein [Parvularcula mediterranea]